MRNQTNIKRIKMKNRKYQTCNQGNQEKLLNKNNNNLCKTEKILIIFLKRLKISF